MSNLIKNVSPEDKKMLNRIFLRSFTVFCFRRPAVPSRLVPTAGCTPSSPRLTATTPMTPRPVPKP